MTTVSVAQAFSPQGDNLAKLAKDFDSAASRAREYPTTIQFENLSAAQISQLMSVISNGEAYATLFPRESVAALLRRLSTDPEREEKSESDEDFYSQFVSPNSELSVVLAESFNGTTVTKEAEFLFADVSDQIIPRLAFVADLNEKFFIELRWGVGDREPNFDAREGRWALMDKAIEELKSIHPKVIALPVVSTEGSLLDDVHPSLRKEFVGFCAIRQISSPPPKGEEANPKYALDDERVQGILDRLVGYASDIPSSLFPGISREQLLKEFPVDGPARNEFAIRFVEGFLLIVGPKSNARTLSQDLTALELAQFDLEGKLAGWEQVMPLEIISRYSNASVGVNLLRCGDVNVDEDTISKIETFIRSDGQSCFSGDEIPAGCTIRCLRSLYYASGIALKSLYAEDPSEQSEFSDENNAPTGGMIEDDYESTNQTPELVEKDFSVEVVSPSSKPGQLGYMFTFMRAHTEDDDDPDTDEPSTGDFGEAVIEVQVERLAGSSSGFLKPGEFRQFLTALGEKLPHKLPQLTNYDFECGLFGKLSPATRVLFQVQVNASVE